MKSNILKLGSIKKNSKINAIKLPGQKFWSKEMRDRNGINVNIHELKVERSVISGSAWILCLYHKNSFYPEKHIFYFNYSEYNEIKLSVI